MRVTTPPLTLPLTVHIEVTVVAGDVTAKMNTAPEEERYFIDLVCIFNRLFGCRRVSEGNLRGSRAYVRRDIRREISADW